MAVLQPDPLDLSALLAATERADSGALVVFGGTVRNENAGRAVQGIGYSAYVPLAQKTLLEIEHEVMQRFAVQECRIVHRVGELAVKDLSVLVVVRAAHRADAFDAARHAIDTLKQRVAIWKHEHYASGESQYLDGTNLNVTTE